MDIEVSITGGKDVAAKINRFVSGDMDLSRSMGETGLYLSRFFAGEVFTSRGGVFGERWPVLNASYAAWKARAFPGRPPLMRTGLMNSSFKHKSTALTTSLWNEAHYFKYHQDGRGVPKRMMMKVDEQRAERIVKYVLSDLTTQMQRANLL